jgi:hypothetical protein
MSVPGHSIAPMGSRVMRGSPYLRALDTGLHGGGLPYGYAITVWSTGTTITGAQGKPSTASVFLFASGAAAAYGALRLMTKHAEGDGQKLLTRSPHLVRAGFLHVLAIGLAIASAALIGQIPSGVTWPLASFAATLLYFGVTSVEMALLEGEASADGA